MIDSACIAGLCSLVVYLSARLQIDKMLQNSAATSAYNFVCIGV